MGNHKSDDGQFWMSFEDMVSNFYCINICYVRIKELNGLEWFDEHRLPLEYVFGETHVDSVNMYRLTLDRSAEVLFHICSRWSLKYDYFFVTYLLVI